MKAIVAPSFGTPDVLRVENLDEPTPGPGEARIALRAVSLNGSDAECLSGEPLYARIHGLRRPRHPVLGSDVAGIVDVVGPGVTEVARGDAVFADLLGSFGGLAELVCAPVEKLVRKPEGLTFEQAATLPQAGTVALQAVRDCGRVRTGQQVLIIGAGGGVGTFAVQLAVDAGAEVTAVDHANKEPRLRALGAARFLDSRTEDLAADGRRFDLILDVPGQRSVVACRRALKPGGRYAIIGGRTKHLLQALLLGGWAKLTRRRRVGVLPWQPDTRDIETLAELVVAGRVVPAIDRCLPLEETREAFELLRHGRVFGKVVITMGS